MGKPRNLFAGLFIENVLVDERSEKKAIIGVLQ
jgi:hypothetical protein